jgi:hypothetical protein
MIKDYKVSWEEYVDPNHAHGTKYDNMLVKASNKTEAKNTMKKILGARFISMMGVRSIEVEEWPIRRK